jgi:RNA polymerase sigma factor (sigma-70 family)
VYSERTLIEGCLSGKRQAWESLVRRYERLIYSIALRTGLSEEDAADVFVTVCAALVENLKTLRDDQHLTGWLILTARRESWRLKRQTYRHDRLQHEDGEASLTSLASEEALPHDVLVRLKRNRWCAWPCRNWGEVVAICLNCVI